ncbi:MAG: M3 family oligoendopeptidase [Planctomycetota bacterium]
MSTTAMPVTDFVPADLDGSRWDNLKPYYDKLLARELKCENCLEQLILDRSELDATASEASANLYISMTCHTDEDAHKSAYLEFVENVQPQLKEVGFALDRKIVESEHVSKLDQARYGVMLRDIRADVELFRDENIPLQTQDTKLGQQFSEVSGAMTVQFRGEEKTMPQMATYIQENDRATREEAWRGMAERRIQDRDRLDDIFDEMIRVRHQIARNAGFDNYRDYMFKAKHRFDYTPADCEAYHAAAASICVPVMRASNATRKQELGADALRPWDLGVDVKGRDPLRPFSGSDELIEGTSKLFHDMSRDLGDLFDRLRDGTSLDLETRKGKSPGGYQYHRDRSRQPFIFMNAAGLQRDLQTMIHEAGHAFHAMLSENDPLLHYRHSPIEFAEVASMGMELLAQPYLDQFYDAPADADRARREHLEGLATMIPWTATIDAFQHWIYTHPDHTREERTAHWLELESTFGPAVDWTGLEDFRASMWQKQLHLFEVPFYYIEYGIAQLGALQLWQIGRRDESQAIGKYREALTLGGSQPLPDLFNACGIKLAFDSDTMGSLMDDVASELERLPV